MGLNITITGRAGFVPWLSKELKSLRGQTSDRLLEASQMDEGPKHRPQGGGSGRPLRVAVAHLSQCWVHLMSINSEDAA